MTAEAGKVYAKAREEETLRTPVFKVKNTVLMNKLTEPTVKRLSETLNMYLRDEDLTDSPYVKWGRRTLESGRWFYKCKSEADIQRRQRYVIALYDSFKQYGYDPHQALMFDRGHGYTTFPIMVYFNEEGRINVCDGFHRLAVLSFLNIVTDVDVAITDSPLCLDTEHTGRKEGDFPLVQTLIKLNNGRNVYQPVFDSRVKGFNVWRKDSPNRLAYLLRKLQGKTVLDIGCCEGYFSRELAKRGYDVTAIDSNPHRVAVTRYLSTVQNLQVSCQVATWQKFLDQDVQFDNVLFLSVFHHTLLTVGVVQAFASLAKVRGKADRVFLEVPIDTRKIAWISPEKKTMYSFTEQEFKFKLERQTSMKVTDVRRGTRPIFLLES